MAPALSRHALIVASILACVACDSREEPLNAKLVSYKYVSSAMKPTLSSPSILTVREFGDSADLVSLKRGDIVQYVWPIDSTKKFVHRLVGLPGDTLAMRHGVLEVNGRTYPEPYAWRDGAGADSVSSDFAWQREYALEVPRSGYRASRSDWGPLLISPSRYFVLGDNRDNSLVSRYWGLLPAANLRGVVQQ